LFDRIGGRGKDEQVFLDASALGGREPVKSRARPDPVPLENRILAESSGAAP
jgi:hypothetical protein